jgi:hypothetical protein
MDNPYLSGSYLVGLNNTTTKGQIGSLGILTNSSVAMEEVLEKTPLRAMAGWIMVVEH